MITSRLGAISILDGGFIAGKMGPQRNRSTKKGVREETIFVVVNAS